MSVIRNLSVTLTANISKFRKRMKEAGKSLKTFGAAIKSISINIAKFGAAIAAVAAVGMAAWIRQSFKAIDVAAKFADRIGISVEALTGLEHAAEISGVTVRNLRLGLQRMTRRIAEAAQGTGEAKAAIKELGLDAAALVRMPIDEQFMAIADAMLAVHNQSDRVRLGFKLFDAEGVGLVNILKRGAAGIRELRAEADALGISFSRGEAAKVERANDAMTRLRAAVRGVRNTLAIELAPVLEKVVMKIVEWAKEGGGLKNRILELVDVIIRGVAAVVNSVEDLRNEVLAFKASFKVDIKDAFGLLGRVLFGGDSDGGGKGFKRAGDRVLEFWQKLRGEIGQTKRKMIGLFELMDELEPKTSPLVPQRLIGGGRPAHTPETFEATGRAFRARRAFDRLRRGGFAAFQRGPVNIEGLGTQVDLDRIQAVRNFASGSAANLTNTLSSAVTEGLFRGFRNGEQLVRAFGEQLTQTMIQAFTEATIGRSAQNLFERIFQPIVFAGGSLNPEN